ncbi:MAG: DUF4129 domain-containing protein [Gammaproteobacteria bacterium]
MRSGSKRGAAAAVLLFAALVCGAQERQQTGDFTRKEVTAALEQLEKDPNLAPDRTIRSLKWVESEADKKKKRDLSWLRWIGEFFAWITQNGRFLFWAVLAGLAGLLLVYLTRLVRNWSLPGRSARIDVPSFVRDLDIRPQSLPTDIGATARQSWDSGEQRAALALLYRGLLSRLVHVHQVPIKDSTTEGDCLALANRHLKDEERRVYIASLVRLWQRAVYGGESVPTESVHALCEGFAGALDRPENAASAPAGAIASGART